jgi:hypothetical protein
MPRIKYTVERISTKLDQPESLGRKSRSRRTATTSTGALSGTCSCWMAPTSIAHSSKMAGAGGIESMRRGIRCWKGESTKYEWDGKATARTAVGVAEKKIA